MPLAHRTPLLIVIFLALGALAWTWHHELIIVRFSGLSRNVPVKHAATKKSITLFYYLHDSWHSEIVDSLWSTNPAHMLIFVLNNWLTFLDEEKIMPHKVSVQSAIVSPTGTEAFVSLDRNPFHAQESSYSKFMWMESLLKTIRANNIPLQQLRLLIKHAPFHDHHLDFTISWPVHGFLQEIVPPAALPASPPMLTAHAMAASSRSTVCTIMIDPSGDSQWTGRTIGDSYERSITMDFAQKLKQMIEQSFPTTRVILTRYTGEVVEPLQNANFANRLHPDLYLTIHFYQEQESTPTLSIFHYVKDPTDVWPKNVSLTNFIPFDQAHMVSSNKTSIMQTIFTNSCKKMCHIDIKNSALPFHPLKGIISPAIGIEIGLKQSSDSDLYLLPLSHAIGSIIQSKEQ